MTQTSGPPPWIRRGKQATAVAVGFGAAALGGFAAGLLRRRDATYYLRGANHPVGSDPADDADDREWLTAR